MRMFKRIALMAIILILSVTLNVYAGVTEVVLEASTTQAKVGETVTITLTGKSATGIEGVDSVLEYDKTKLQLTNTSTLAAENFTSMSDTNDLTGKFQLSVMYTGTDAAPQIAEFATLTFKVLEGAEANETLTIKLSDIELGGSDDDWTEVADQTVTIKVVGDEQNPDDGEQNPDDGEQNPDDGEEETPPSEDYPYAGIEDYVFIIIAAVIIVAVVCYKKSNKYRDIR